MRVSVVIPCYNSGSLLESTVESALAQSVPPHELLFLDDGSTDDTWQRLEGIRSRYGECIRIFRRPENVGYGMRHELIGHARSEWIAYLDHDDLWMPEKLERQIRAHERHPRAEVIHTDGWNQPRDDVSARTLQERPEYLGPADPHEALFFRNFILVSSAIHSRDLFYRVGGTAGSRYTLTGDHELWLRISRSRAPFLRVPEPLTTRRVLPSGQLSGRRIEHLRGLIVMYEDHAQLNRRNPRVSPRRARRRILRAILDLIHDLLVQESSEHFEEAAELWATLIRDWGELDAHRHSLIRLMALSRFEEPKTPPTSRNPSGRWKGVTLGNNEKASLLDEWKRSRSDPELRDKIARETSALFRLGGPSPPFVRLHETEVEAGQKVIDRAWSNLERRDRRWAFFRRR